MRSLRTNLLIWLLPTTFLVGVLASIGTYWGDYLTLENTLDDQLKYIAHHINLSNSTHSINLKQTLSSKAHDHEDQDDEVILEVWENNKRQFASHPSIDFAPPTRTGIINETVNGKIWHTFVMKSDDKWILIAQAQNLRFETLASLSINLFWPVLAMLPLLAIFLWFGIGYGLKPLRHISEELKSRNAKSLDPIIPARPVKEIQPFIQALNDLLERLQQTFIQQERFIADAAHELRTPIMGLSVEMQVMARETDPIKQQKSLIQLQKSISRLSHLSEQLLTLAKIDPEKSDQSPEEVELTNLCKLIITDSVNAAERKNIDLGMGKQTAAVIMGFPDDLRILISNLIDNAIRYIPENGTIDVSVYKEKGEVILEVSDNGPGIPEAERLKVTERFYRGKHPKIHGSGLGMNIVKNISDNHHAVLTLTDSEQETGLCVRVTFKGL